MAQIKYLDSRRIMGASNDIVENLNYVDENYSSSTGWTQVSTNIAISNGKVQFSSGVTATSRIYKALPFTADNTKWIIDFELLYSTAANGDQLAPLCISDGTDHPTGSATNSICVHSYHNGAGVTNDTVSVSYRDGGSLTNVFSLATNLTNGTRYYMRLERTSSTNVKLTAYSNSARTSSVTSNNGTIPSTLDGLTTIHHSSHHTTGANQTAEIDNLKFYDGVTGTPFTVTNKPAPALSLSGCKAYYNFEQTSGSLTNIATTANGFDDGLGSSADGTNNGATTGSTGIVGSYAWDFDGINDYVSLGNNFTSFQGGDLTISLWAKITASLSGNQGLVTKDWTSHTDPYRSISIVNSNGNYVLWLNDNGSWNNNLITIASSPTTNVWHHIVVTRSGNTWTAYYDNNSVGSTTASPTFTTTDWEIGRARNLNYFDGSIDEVVFFNRALTSSEISALYNDGTGVAVNDSSITAKPETNSIFIETDGGRRYLFDGSEWYLTLKGGSGYATRAVFSGGSTGSESNTMDYVTIQTTGNATDFGDLVYARHYLGATSDTSRGVTVGGYDTSAYSHIDYYTIATPANAQTFGSLTTGKAPYDSCVCDSVNVLQFGGFTGSSATSDIEYFGIRSLGNASIFGNLATALYAKFGLDDTFRAVAGGGGGYNTVMDYVTMRTPSNSTSFGNLTQGRGWSGATASTTRGVIGGGDAGSVSNVIDYITIQTTGNATDFGDLSVARTYLSATGDRSRGLFGGGSTNYSNGNNTMDYITISTTGNATDFGDLTVARFGIAGCSGK